MKPRRIASLSDDERTEITDRSADADVADDVRPIVERVRDEGDDALREFTRRFDGVEVDSIRVEEDEIREARESCDDEVFEAIEHAAERIRDFHEKQVRDDWSETEDGVEVGRRFVPLSSAGAYVPGGGAAYPSTALMTVVPARVAGVENVVACTPPSVPDATLAALNVAGADAVYRVGGAQAISAMAYGTETVEACDAIVGPGNVYVTEAKRQVRDDEAARIEFPAGPSEILVVADETANPRHVASDMLAQTEHDADASAVLTATDEELADEVVDEMEKRIEEAERGETMKSATCEILVGDLDACVEFTNEYAPEHLSIVTSDDDAVLSRIRNAGSVFLGTHTPVAAGDYATGTNHVLPTAGGARLYGGLSVDDFVKTTTYQRLSRNGIEKLAETVTTLARAEGLEEHARSVEERLEPEDMKGESDR
ncbi:MAG: histidinol dehydrogenase [Halobacteriales archaeon]|nr:histidinol dehydrogenase [Halobacteriales archaeon]